VSQRPPSLGGVRAGPPAAGRGSEGRGEAAAGAVRSTGLADTATLGTCAGWADATGLEVAGGCAAAAGLNTSTASENVRSSAGCSAPTPTTCREIS
jgi:hypothetical protein